MKKVLLTAMAILTVASTTVFGMYGNGDSWIDFLVHGNQFRARMDQLGFTLGNGTIKGTFGFKQGSPGAILKAVTGNENKDNDKAELIPAISLGLGYTSEAFGIGLGYSYKYVNDKLGIHTPVLTVNALNDNLRIAIPFQIASASDFKDGNNFITPYDDAKDYLGLRTDIQVRYYTGIDAFNAIRLYVQYGQSGYKKDTGVSTSADYFASSLGLELRLYFLNTMVGNAGVNPYLKLKYRTALEGGSKDVSSIGLENNLLHTYAKDYKGTKPYDFLIAPTVALTANSDVVSLLFEPSLGYTIAGSTGGEGNQKDPSITHTLAWGAYTELYFTPVKDLEWYFELDVNNYEFDTSKKDSGVPVYFETSTGITWYLPSFNGAE